MELHPDIDPDSLTVYCDTICEMEWNDSGGGSWERLSQAIRQVCSMVMSWQREDHWQAVQWTAVSRPSGIRRRGVHSEMEL